MKIFACPGAVLTAGPLLVFLLWPLMLLDQQNRLCTLLHDLLESLWSAGQLAVYGIQ